MVQALATGCMLAGVDYMATDVLDRKGASTILFVCFVGPALLLTPAWAALGARIGKKRGYLTSSLILAAGALLAVLARSAPFGARRRRGRAGRRRVRRRQVFPLAMLPDAAAVDARRTGSSRVGVYTGVWTAGETLGLALGPGLFALVLAARRLPVEHRRRRGPVGLRPDRDHARLLGAARRCSIVVSLVWLVRYTLGSDQVDESPTGVAGMSDALERLKALQAADLPVHGGRTLAYVYDSGSPDVDRIGREAVAAYAGSNGLDPTAFPSLLRMENDLVGFALGLLDGPDSAVGTVTSGGTESVLLAVQAARDAHPDVAEPRMVLPATAHAAFHKAAHYFGVEPVLVPVGADFTADVAATEAADRRGPRPDGAGGRERAVVRARRRRPGHRARGPGGGARDPVPRRRVHRRLGAAVRRAARPGRAPVDVCGGGGHLDLGRPAQVRLRAQGHLAAAAPHLGAAASRSSSRRRRGRATRC